MSDSVVCAPVKVGEIGRGGQGQRIYSVHGKTICLSAEGGGKGGKTGLYKIDLPDGDYIVRKLTPVEAERCQTLPDGYTAFGTDADGKTIKISNTQRYKTIGNGWTVEAVAHMFSFMAEQSAK
jgi:DNA (cytosine-5)-methyltransferase 3A